MYLKRNVPMWERAVRVMMGAAMVVVGLVVLHASLLGIAVAAMAAVPILTGFVGYCPMCARVGRRPVGATGSR